MTGLALPEVEDWLAGKDPAPAAPAAPAAPDPPAAPQAAATTLAAPAPWFVDWAFGRTPGEGGLAVNEHTALAYGALYSCVSLIAQTIASLPLKVYRRRPDGGQDEVPDRPEYDLLQTEFNPNTSAMTGRETGVGHFLTWGNSYCQIVRSRAGGVLRLQPLGPDIVQPVVNDRGELEYEVYERSTGRVLETLPREEVLHVPGLGFDALAGYSTVRVARHTIRTGVAQDREAERFITRGIRPPGAIKMGPGKKFADEKAAMRFRDSFRRVHSVEDGSLQIVVLEDGMDWVALGIDPESAQVLESRKFTALEVCGIYHVPPHMVGLVEKTSAWGTGIEELTIGFVVYCILPILRRIEQEYDRKLFRAKADRGMFCEHVLGGLLRGDALKRAQALEIMCRNGIVTVNEWRRLENLNPVPGGNVRYYPLNMGRTDADTGADIPPPAAAVPTSPPAIPPASPEPPEPEEPEGPEVPPEAPAEPPEGRAGRLAAALRKGVVAAVSRCLRKEAAEARRFAKKPGEFLAWLDDFYGRHAEMVEESVGPVLEAWRAAFPRADAWPAGFVGRHIDRSRGELLEAAAGAATGGLAEAVERVVSRWQTDRLADLAAAFQPEVPSHAV